MRIPDVEGLKDAHESFSTSNATIAFDISINYGKTNSSTSESSGTVLAQPKSLGRASAVLNAANDTSPATPAYKANQHGELSERQSSCPKGSAFFKCRNGFTGCCSVNPCDPGQTCPDGPETEDEGSTAMGSARGAAGTSATRDQTMGEEKSTRKGSSDSSGTQTAKNDSVTSSTNIRTDSTTSTLASTSSRKTPRPTTSPAPNCPSANGKTYNDNFKIQYRIHCNSNNIFDSFDSIAVGIGGYDQCFSACSQKGKCTGFTYVGRDSGNCYLKAQMPNGTYEAKKGDNYTSCAKLDPHQNAGHDPGAANKEQAKRSTGAIVGGVVGGVVLLGLLLLCIALIAKRRRKKIETRRRSTVTHIFHGSVETDMTQPRE